MFPKRHTSLIFVSFGFSSALLFLYDLLLVLRIARLQSSTENSRRTLRLVRSK